MHFDIKPVSMPLADNLLATIDKVCTIKDKKKKERGWCSKMREVVNPEGSQEFDTDYSTQHT